ncbi:MAG: response regulator [Chloroflexi bacterium]|nr:response regulator [Chloroflexota bacterium]
MAEDNDEMRAMLSTLLARLDADVDLVADGASAVRAVERAHEQHAPYDAIVLDAAMPVLDGYAAALEIRKNEQLYERRHSPLAFISAYAEELERTGIAARLGAQVWRKPDDLPALPALIHQLVQAGAR